MRKYIFILSLLFLTSPVQADEHQKIKIIKKILPSKHPLHEAITQDLDLQTFLKALNLLKKRKANFNQFAEIEGMKLSPLAYFIYHSKPRAHLHPKKDIREKLDMLDALRYRGAKINRDCFDKIRKKLETDMPVYDALELPQRTQINRLFEHLQEPHLGLPPDMIELNLISPYGNHEHTSYTLQGISHVDNYNGTHSFVTYFMVKDQGHVRIKPYALNPLATKLFVLMLGGEISPAEIFSTLEQITDMKGLQLIEISNLAMLAHLAPGFPALKSREKRNVLGPDLYKQFKEHLRLPQVDGPLLDKLELLTCLQKPLTKRINLNTPALGHINSKVLYHEEYSSLIMAWKYGQEDNQLHITRNPLAKLMMLEIALGFRNPKKLRSMLADVVRMRDLEASSGLIHYLYEDRGLGESAEYAACEVFGENYDKAIELYQKLVGYFNARYKQPQKSKVIYSPPKKTPLPSNPPKRKYSTKTVTYFPAQQRRTYTTRVEAKNWGAVTRRNKWGRIPRAGIGMFTTFAPRRGPGIFRFLRFLK